MSFGTRGRVDHAISGSAMSRRPHFIRCYVTAMVQRLDAHEVARDEAELAPRLELRLRRRVALDLREGVEGAPLGPGARSGLAHGLGEPAPAVGDDHALEFSDLAMYHETTRSPLQHMNTTSSRASRIPSTWSTQWSSPSGTGIARPPRTRPSCA